MSRLVLFAKQPRLGQVKTRLVPPLRPDQALSLYAALLADTLDLVRRARGAGVAAEVCFDGPLGPSTRGLDLAGLEVHEQGAGDLGERLLRAFTRCRAAGSAATVVLGADAPTLPTARFDEAFAALREGADLVLAPATDGGYVLIGLRAPEPALFSGVPWGGSRVLDATLAAASARGLRTCVLEGWYDVDDRTGLEQIRRHLADPVLARRCPATLAALAGLERAGSLDPLRKPVV